MLIPQVIHQTYCKSGWERGIDRSVRCIAGSGKTMTGISRKLSRRVVIAAPLGGLAAASVAGLTAHAEPGAEALERRIFTAAYEDMTNGAERLRQLADRFGQAGVDEIAVSIGRIERALFPWEGQVPPPSEPQQD